MKCHRTCHKTRLRAGVGRNKAQGWCSFGGWLWEEWKTGRKKLLAMGGTGGLRTGVRFQENRRILYRSSGFSSYREFA